jgi:hypothetical protein
VKVNRFGKCSQKKGSSPVSMGTNTKDTHHFKTGVHNINAELSTEKQFILQVLGCKYMAHLTNIFISSENFSILPSPVNQNGIERSPHNISAKQISDKHVISLPGGLLECLLHFKEAQLNTTGEWQDTNTLGQQHAYP